MMEREKKIMNVSLKEWRDKF